MSSYIDLRYPVAALARMRQAPRPFGAEPTCWVRGLYIAGIRAVDASAICEGKLLAIDAYTGSGDVWLIIGRFGECGRALMRQVKWFSTLELSVRPTWRHLNPSWHRPATDQDQRSGILFTTQPLKWRRLNEEAWQQE